MDDRFDKCECSHSRLVHGSRGCLSNPCGCSRFASAPVTTDPRDQRIATLEAERLATDPHPTARALVEAWFAEYGHVPVVEWLNANALVDRITAALTAAHDAGQREGREEMREWAARIVGQSGHEFIYEAQDAIRQLPLDDAARGEEKGKK